MPSSEDLQRVGELLRDARERAGLQKSETARRVGVTPAYIAFVERARPNTRGRGNPSRPRRELLLAWTRAVEMHEERAREVLSLAGYDLGPESGSLVRELSPPYEDWALRRDEVLKRVQEVVRLAEGSPHRYDLVETLERVVALLEFRLRHEEP